MNAQKEWMFGASALNWYRRMMYGIGRIYTKCCVENFRRSENELQEYGSGWEMLDGSKAEEKRREE